jgi:hypothetical protein
MIRFFLIQITNLKGNVSIPELLDLTHHLIFRKNMFRNLDVFPSSGKKVKKNVFSEMRYKAVISINIPNLCT